ncbi:MAG: Uncharacterized protein Athens071426_527 [Parcubacteria group bacterium Athens0714_26]|nr:MAG: Uncharacterized protein Athens071426_527 [Parcubacteria group bacterium Athens0714_26]
MANINDFYNDFRNGGWIAYQEMWRPQNNFYGATLLALDEVDKQQTAAQNAAYAEGVAGGGFLSIKKCDSNGKNCVIETPGTFVAGAAKKYLIDTPADRFIGADSMVAYAAAIIDALVNKFIETGVKALQGK